MATSPARKFSGEEASNNKMPNDESAFQNWIRGTDWFKEFKAEYNEEPDLDTKDYDYRAAWKAGISPERDPYDRNRFHWPSSLPTGEMLKSAEHPTAWKEYFMRDTGVNPDSLGLKTPEDANNYLKKKSDQKTPNNKGSAMATMLDAVKNPLGQLGLTSLMGTPVKEKPPVVPSSQAAFPSIERPADPRPEIERRRDEIGLTSSNIDVQILNNLAQQGQFQAEQAQQKAESEAQSLRELDTSRKALEKSLYESPAYKTIQEKSKELAEKSTFNPDQQNAQTLAAVFSIIGAAGFLLGGNNKNTAKAALAAMNGMAEGYSKGRDQYAKEQRQAFETNQKALRGTLDSLEKAFTYEIEQNKGNIESATRNAKIAALERDASFINSNINKYGLVSTLEQLRSNKKRLDTVVDALDKQEKAYEAKLNDQFWKNEKEKYTAAAAQNKVEVEDRFRRERLELEDRLRREREDRSREDTQRFQLERDRFRLENRLERGQGAGQTQRATQQQAITQRAVNSLGGVASALETIVELPQGSTTGWLPNLQTKDGMFNAIRNQLGRKISPVDAELMNTTFTGIGRNLAAIESSGLASGLSTLANQMEKGTYISAGVDDPYKVAMKLADIKRIATENIQPSIDSGLMTDKQAKTAQELVNRIEKIIPYNTRDVAIAYREATSRTRGKPTVGQSSAQVVKPGEGWSDRDERRLQELEEKARGSQPK